MINSILRKFIQNSHLRGNLYLLIYRRETTDLITKNEGQQKWEKKMKFYMKTYEDLFGITKLSEMHDRVLDIQINLQSIQERRRKVQEEIFVIQKKLQEMQNILYKTPLGDDTYITVVTQVHELLKEQKRLQDLFSLYDQNEREQHTALAMAINTSQDHEKTYREKNKYLSLITGVIGGILGVVGSSINNWRHRKDIKHFASDISDQVVDLKESVEKLKLVVSTDGILLNAASDESEEAKDILSSIKSQHDMLDNSIKSLQSLVNSREIKHLSNTEYSGCIEDLLNEHEKHIETKLNNHSYINLSLIGSYTLLLSILIYYLTRSN